MLNMALKTKVIRKKLKFSSAVTRSHATNPSFGNRCLRLLSTRFLVQSRDAKVMQFHQSSNLG